MMLLSLQYLFVFCSCFSFIFCQTIEVEQGSQKPLKGENVTLACTGKGESILWRHRKRNITTDEQDFTIEKLLFEKEEDNVIGSRLNILNIKESGRYKCIIWNEGKEFEKNLAIHIQVPPKVQRTQNDTVSLDSEAVLECASIGNPVPQISWYFKDQALSKDINERYKIEKENKSSIHISRLSITKSSLHDNGTYKCMFENKHGKDEGQPALLVQGPPEVSWVKARSLAPKQIQLQWSTKKNNSPINSTEIMIYGDELAEVTIPVSPADSMSLILEEDDLSFLPPIGDDPLTLQINIRVTNALNSDDTGYLNITMRKKKPLFVPKASFKGSTLDSLHVWWDSPSDDVAEFIGYYLLTLTNLKTGGDLVETIEDYTSTHHLFTNLLDGTKYKFTVSACMAIFEEKEKDCFPPSEAISHKTLSHPPNSVSDISVNCISNRTSGNNKVIVIWEPPVNDSNVAEYKIELVATANYVNKFGKEKFYNKDFTKIFSSNITNHTFVEMMPNTNYTVKVYAGAGSLFSSPLVSNCQTPYWVPHFDRLRWWKAKSESGTVLKLQTPMVSQRNGTVCCHRIVVVRLGKNKTLHDLPLPHELPLISYSIAHDETTNIGGYVAEAFSSRNVVSEYMFVGDGKIAERDPNACAKCLGLDPVASHRLERLLSQTEDENLVNNLKKIKKSKRSPEIAPLAQDMTLSKDNNYTGFLILNVRDKNGTSLASYSDYFNVIQPKDDQPYTTPSPVSEMTNIVYILGALIVVLILMAFILGVLLCHYHRKRKPMIEDGLDESLTGRIFRTLRGTHTLMSQPGIDVKPIQKDELVSQYLDKIKDSGLGFRKEFEALPERFFDRSSRGSEQSENSCKNRYPDIKAYDQTRVKLSQINCIVGSDYVNANYVMGYKERKKFICAQGPMESTVDDFWRMIVEQRSSLCIMLTNLEETGKIKCVKYWPEAGEPKTFGNITVRLVKEKPYADYLVRTLRAEWPAHTPPSTDITQVTNSNSGAEENGIINNGTNTTKSNSSTCNSTNNSNYNSLSSHSASASEETKFHEVQQYHYLVWKDFVAPEHPVGLLSFLRRINRAYSPDMGPLLVHCSAGVGRTGTLVALDTLVSELDEEKQASIYNTICDLRHQRNFLVQSLKQYIFIHRALMEYAQFGNTELPMAHLKDFWVQHTQHNSDEPSDVAKQFERLGKVIEDRKAFTVANSDMNKSKNRYDYVLPYDTNCVILQPLPSQMGSTYINASFLAGFDLGENFIITQDPLQNTMGDFWRMVYEQEVNTIVMLSELGSGEESCSKYWPDTEETYEHITIRYISSESYPKYNTRSFAVTNSKNGDSITVTQFQYVGWSGQMGEVPLVTFGIMELITRVQTNNDTNPSNLSPTVVHCSGGGDRSSVYVCLNNCLRQLRSETCVDIFQAARKIRSQRQFQLQDLSQFEFVYKALVEYVDLKGGDNL